MSRRHIFPLILLLIAAWVCCALWRCAHPIANGREVAESEMALASDTILLTRPKAPPFTISPYDTLLRQYADSVGWDWRWLAAIAYYESRFHADATNPSGATGLMQMMPQTAQALGIDSLTLSNPRQNVRAASRLFCRLNTLFDSSAMPDRVCMVLAAYNAGTGHVYDAQRLATRYGSNPKQWFGNVEYFLAHLNEAKYYNDPLCHSGYFSGGETIRFVHNVWDKYMEYCRLEHLYNSVNVIDRKNEK